MTNLQMKSLLKNLKIVGSAFLTEDQIDLLETLCDYSLAWDVDEVSTEQLSKELPLLNDTVENIAISINEKYEEVKEKYSSDIIWIEECEGETFLSIHPTVLEGWLNIASKTFTKEAEQAQAEFMAEETERLTRFSRELSSWSDWRSSDYVQGWMTDCIELGFIKIIYNDDKSCFKLEITQAGIDILKQETITDRSDIEGKSEFSCNDPAFDFKFYLLETAENYDRPLTKKAVKNIFAEIAKHHESEFGDYDRIEYALCTESNEYPAGINIDNRYGEFYVLDFADTDVVLHLVK